MKGCICCLFSICCSLSWVEIFAKLSVLCFSIPLPVKHDLFPLSEVQTAVVNQFLSKEITDNLFRDICLVFYRLFLCSRWYPFLQIGLLGSFRSFGLSISGTEDSRSNPPHVICWRDFRWLSGICLTRSRHTTTQSCPT